ncbi:LysR family transcriptional regulator [Planomonospora sp. ID82291]|uniref:LysR family transcriptional regulator n=1 Tax=Planomonospora sp. ID82291 TaxID=2738136 RepID=UPI0018C43308|nr:LysR family transcriptional regulator [Planomonospora sp. ID82291]MBG0817841.1 LysR family transcriptional regulator [Planomonospora sp. ID82291]
MPININPRLFRVFVTAAEEQHFGRAAARMYLAQQALSRDIAQLERLLGYALFTRSTRRVVLTGDGERLLPRARRLLALHDEIAAGSPGRPFLADLNSPGMLTERFLAAVRAAAPELEFIARFYGGLTAAAADLVTCRLDVSFGRFAGLGPPVRRALVHHPVRLQPLALIVLDGHPLAGLPEIPMALVRGVEVSACAEDPRTPEWSDMAARLFAEFGVLPAPGWTAPAGTDEMAHHMRRHPHPVLSTVDGPHIPGTVLRPLVAPVPLHLLGLVHHPALDHPGLEAIRGVTEELARAGGWLLRPPGTWLPAEDEALLPLSSAG